MTTAVLSEPRRVAGRPARASMARGTSTEGRPVRRRVIGLAAVGLIGLGGLAVWAAWPAPPAPSEWSADYDTAAKAPDTIAAGTVVGTTAPKGWSHLVIKSTPRLRADQKGKVNDLTARMAGWMFTAFAADVRPDAGTGRHAVKAVGLGLGTAVDGKDTVITPEAFDRYRGAVGVIGRQILTKAYEQQNTAVVPVHGPTLAVVDTPVFHRGADGKHRLVRFRYALLADAATGKLETLCWALAPEGAGPAGGPQIARLRPDTVDEAELLVDPNEFTLGLPSEAAFAVEGLPPNRGRVKPPAALWALAGQTKFTPAQARDLEAGLRGLLPYFPNVP